MTITNEKKKKKLYGFFKVVGIPNNIISTSNGTLHATSCQKLICYPKKSDKLIFLQSSVTCCVLYLAIVQF